MNTYKKALAVGYVYKLHTGKQGKHVHKVKTHKVRINTRYLRGTDPPYEKGHSQSMVKAIFFSCVLRIFLGNFFV